ncbi:hypothetical protein [Kitasatospora sp. NPDC002040]|uniref:hypothetical protein n=1 Tax=Kitasatospora sp. NPDC002040 TaxID=3154661 RepID=UPI003333B569
MQNEIIAKARFLLTELHLSPEHTVARLKDYYPGVGLTERIRHVNEARDLIEGTSIVARPAPSDMQQARSFAWANEHHGATV